MGDRMDSILHLLMERWTPSILYALKTRGPLHVGEMQRIVGVSQRMMYERERTLVAAGLVRREDIFHVVRGGGGFRFTLTERGHELDDVLEQLVEIGSRWQAEDAKARNAAPRRRRSGRWDVTNPK